MADKKQTQSSHSRHNAVKAGTTQTHRLEEHKPDVPNTLRPHFTLHLAPVIVAGVTPTRGTVVAAVRLVQDAAVLVLKRSRTPHCSFITLLTRILLTAFLHLWTAHVHTLPARVDIVAVKCVSTAGPHLSVGAKCQLSPAANLRHAPAGSETLTVWPEALWNSIPEAHKDFW